MKWCNASILLSVLSSGPALVAPAIAADAWMTDLPAAMRKAEKEQKLVLIDFTGSDWCSACNLLRRNVLDTTDFRSYAAERFVLMEVDLPHRSSFDPALRARNEAIAARYGIAGYPTILVINPQGEVMGGFQEGDKSFKEAVGVLDRACEADALFRKASGQSGEERARTLYRIYAAFPVSKSFAAARKSLRREILSCDPRNVTGIHDEEAVYAQAQLFQEQRASLAINSPKMGELLARQLDEALPVNRPEVMMALCQHGMATAESVEDILAVRKMFEELMPLLPEPQASETRQFLETFFRDPENLLRMLKSSRPR